MYLLAVVCIIIEFGTYPENNLTLERPRGGGGGYRFFGPKI